MTNPFTDPPTIGELMEEIHKLKSEAILRNSLIQSQSKMIAHLIEVNQNYRAYIEAAYINTDINS